VKHLTDEDFRLYLDNKEPGKFKLIKNHLDNCKSCWNKWNRLRWDLAKDSEGFKELQAFLGDSFKWYFDASWALAKEWEKKDPKTLVEVEDFYRQSKNYLYVLTLWHESGDRQNYLNEFANLTKKLDVDSCLDYGCGIGSDGLKMLDLGKKVAFYDFDNPSTEFLRWRLKKRNKKAKILFVGKVKEFPSVDLVWAIDVLEHMVDPREALVAISDKTKVFVHESKFGDKAGGRHPFHFNFNINILNRELRKRKFVWDRSFADLNVWIRKA